MENKIEINGLSKPQLSLKILGRNFKLTGNNKYLSEIQDHYKIENLFSMPVELIKKVMSGFSEAREFLEISLCPEDMDGKGQQFLDEAIESRFIMQDVMLIINYIAGCLNWSKGPKDYDGWRERNKENLVIEGGKAKK